MSTIYNYKHVMGSHNPLYPDHLDFNPYQYHLLESWKATTGDD